MKIKAKKGKLRGPNGVRKHIFVKRSIKVYPIHINVMFATKCSSICAQTVLKNNNYNEKLAIHVILNFKRISNLSILLAIFSNGRIPKYTKMEIISNKKFTWTQILDFVK
jgi:hypothetical protein